MLIQKKMQFINKYPLFITAPMVDQSELPFRMLTRKYNSNLCYTPMLHSKMLISAKKYFQQHFTTCNQDRPLVAQICGNDPQIMLQACKLLQKHVDAIDINLGCPQGIARKGHYGSFLLEDSNLVANIVEHLSTNLTIPIFCKIRKLKTEEKTMEVVNKIVQAGCSLLTVHGRTKEQNKDKVGSCDWGIISKIKESVNIPIIANGGVYNFEDVNRCLIETNVDGVMSSEALLENPALFTGKTHCLDSLALQYLENTQRYEGASVSCIRAHLFKMLYQGLNSNIDLREQLSRAANLMQFKQIVTQLKLRRSEVPLEMKFGWYFRYRRNQFKQIQNQSKQKIQDQQFKVNKKIHLQQQNKKQQKKQQIQLW